MCSCQLDNGSTYSWCQCHILSISQFCPHLSILLWPRSSLINSCWVLTNNFLPKLPFLRSCRSTFAPAIPYNIQVTQGPDHLYLLPDLSWLPMLMNKVSYWTKASKALRVESIATPASSSGWLIANIYTFIYFIYLSFLNNATPLEFPISSHMLFFCAISNICSLNFLMSPGEFLLNMEATDELEFYSYIYIILLARFCMARTTFYSNASVRMFLILELNSICC